MPHGLGGLGAVVRIRLGDALAPALRAPSPSTRTSTNVLVVRCGRSWFRRSGPAGGGRGRSSSRSIFTALHDYTRRRRGRSTIIAIEGPIGVGKTALAERLATRLDATIVLEDTENPFLADFYADRPGAALQAQLFYLLNRHRQLTALRQADLFSQTTICDYVFDKDKIFAYLNLDDNELFIYQRLFDLLARDVPPPDLVVYLQAPTDVLLRARPQPPHAIAEAVALAARRRLPARAERGVPPLLLPLHRDAAAGRRDLAVRSRRRRRGARRSGQADQGHGQGHALLRAADQS